MWAGRFDPVRRGVYRRLALGHSGSIELYAENIDSERFPGAEQAHVFTDYLAKKYAGRKIDVIVVQGIRPV